MVAYRIGPRDAYAMTSANTAPRLWGLPGTFWSLWCAQLVNRVASFAQPFLALYLTQERGISVSAAGAVVSGVGVGSVVAALVGGWTADRYGRRVSMLAAQVLLSSALLGLALAQDLWQLAAAALLVGFGGDLIRPAMSATVADSVPAALQVRAYGLLFWAINLGFSVATVSAGALTRWGYPTLFIINAAASVIAGLIIWRGVPETRPASSGEKVTFLPVLLRDGPALVLVVVGTLYSVVHFQAYSALPLVMARQGISPAVYGLVLAVNGVVICLVQPLSSGGSSATAPSGSTRWGWSSSEPVSPPPPWPARPGSTRALSPGGPSGRSPSPGLSARSWLAGLPRRCAVAISASPG